MIAFAQGSVKTWGVHTSYRCILPCCLRLPLALALPVALFFPFLLASLLLLFCLFFLLACCCSSALLSSSLSVFSYLHTLFTQLALASREQRVTEARSKESHTKEQKRRAPHATFDPATTSKRRPRPAFEFYQLLYQNMCNQRRHESTLSGIPLLTRSGILGCVLPACVRCVPKEVCDESCSRLYMPGCRLMTSTAVLGPDAHVSADIFISLHYILCVCFLASLSCQGLIFPLSGQQRLHRLRFSGKHL